MKNCCNFWRHASRQASVRRVYTWRVRMMSKPTLNYHYDWNCLMHLYVRNWTVCLKFTCNPSKRLHDNIYGSIMDPHTTKQSKTCCLILQLHPKKLQISTVHVCSCSVTSTHHYLLWEPWKNINNISNVGARSDPTSPTAKASARRAAEGTPPNNSAASHEVAAWAPIKQI